MKNLLFIVSLSVILFWRCNTDDPGLIAHDETQPASEVRLDDDDAVMKGIIRVKLASEIGSNFTVSTQQGAVRSGQSEVDAYLHQLGATSMERVFPHAGKYEERTRREGLHLWYDITFDQTKSVTRAALDAQTIPGIEIVEEVYRPVLIAHEIHIDNSIHTRAENSPFNDPKLSAQWHYNNTGSTPKSIAGCDIRLFKAWEKETGKPNVIVSVVDGGIDTNHEDLIDNLWINVAEQNGVSGKDNDNNGYINDVHGYNFVSRKGEIKPHSHGTHVSGTVAARNNNGIGVCGVAGGDGTPQSGVRLMSCQIFEFVGEDKDDKTTPSAPAIKYGADNGAVISQNSWGYRFSSGITTTPTSVKAAIDYFIKYAGCDNNGKQLPDSPMKGGIVVFAAGNDDKDYKAPPAEYAPVISVSAIAPDFKKTWYSNQGNWITIAAPGGDKNYEKGMVLSTIPNNKYAYMQGTSMACPHVSGIAALVVSKFGGPGFTNEDLKKRITTSILPVNINEMNPNYNGRLGRGYIDADKALAENKNKAPAKVSAVQVNESFKHLTLKWKAVSDEDDGSATFYKLYYSTQSLTPTNYKNAELITINGFEYSAGKEVAFELKRLAMNTPYYMAIVAEDRWGLESAPFFFEGKTLENLPPKLSLSTTEKIRIFGTQTAEVKIVVEEPEGQEWSFTSSGQKAGVTLKKTTDGILVTFRVVAPVGEHTLTVSVADIFGTAANIEIPFEIYENLPPKLVKPFTKAFVAVNTNNYTVDLSEYFTDENEDAITYTAHSHNPSVAEASIQNNILMIKTLSIGTAAIDVTAKDEYDATVKTTFQFQVAKDELVYTVYPVPAKDVLNVRLSNEIQSATLTIRTTTGSQVHKQKISASSPEQRLIQLNLSKLPGGTYVLYVEANGKTYKQSFIKQ